jgi:hypothetical protein
MFRFTIRDVLWLMVVLAVVVAWWLDRIETNRVHSDLEAKNQELAKALREVTAEIESLILADETSSDAGDLKPETLRRQRYLRRIPFATYLPPLQQSGGQLSQP